MFYVIGEEEDGQDDSEGLSWFEQGEGDDGECFNDFEGLHSIPFYMG
jgi:hypothetical protein